MCQISRGTTDIILIIFKFTEKKSTSEMGCANFYFSVRVYVSEKGLDFFPLKLDIFLQLLKKGRKGKTFQNLSPFEIFN